MKIRLNEGRADKLKTKEHGYEVRDELVPGLVLRVGKKGRKVWEVVVQRGGKRKRMRLGTFPDVSVKAAQKAAEAAKEDAIAPMKQRGVKTVADLFSKYADDRAPKMRAWRDVQSVWDNWALDRIGHVRLTDLSIHHGLDLRDHIATKSSPLRASAVIRYIRPMFAWATDERYLEANPWATLRAKEVAPARQRVLSDMEWAEVWEAAEAEPYPFGPFVQVLMLSAQRLSNVAEMRWDEIAGDVWIIPADKMKATRVEKAATHEVPLSDALADLIAQQPRTGPFVFSTRGDRPISPGSRQKDRIGEAADVSDWRFHDLRRTAATRMTEAGISRFIVERVLGHADKGVTAVYDRNAYRVEKREALTILALFAAEQRGETKLEGGRNGHA